MAVFFRAACEGHSLECKSFGFMEKKINICICGGGSQGHISAGVIGSHNNAKLECKSFGVASENIKELQEEAASAKCTPYYGIIRDICSRKSISTGSVYVQYRLGRRVIAMLGRLRL